MKALVLFLSLTLTLTACNSEDHKDASPAQAATPPPVNGNLPPDKPAPQVPHEDAVLTQNLVASFAATSEKLHLEINEAKITTDALQAHIYKSGDSFSVIVSSCETTETCSPYFTIHYRISITKFFDDTKVSVFFTGGERADGSKFNELKSENGWIKMGVPKLPMVQALFGDRAGLRLTAFAAASANDSKPQPTTSPDPWPIPAPPPAKPLPPPPPVPELPWASRVDSDREINAICNGETYQSDRVNCLLQLKDKIVDPDAARLCKDDTYQSDRVNCLKRMANKRFSPGVIKVCLQETYQSDRVNCMESLADKYINEAYVKVCNGETYQSDRVNCLKKFAD